MRSPPTERFETVEFPSSPILLLTGEHAGALVVAHAGHYCVVGRATQGCVRDILEARGNELSVEARRRLAEVLDTLPQSD